MLSKITFSQTVKKNLISCNFQQFSMINWAIIFDNNAKKSVQDFIDTMKKVCDAVCMKIGEPKKVTVKDERLESYTSKLRSTLSEELNMIVVILKSNRSDYYNAIKK